MTSRKHCATDKNQLPPPLPTPPSARSLLDVVGSRYRQIEKQARDGRGLCKLVQQEALFIGPSSWCALLPLWPLFLYLVPSGQRLFRSLSCDAPAHPHHPLRSDTHDTRGWAPSVHFLSAGQHRLLEEREHQEDPGPLPPLALGEVIRYDIIYGTKKRKKKRGAC